MQKKLSRSEKFPQAKLLQALPTGIIFQPEEHAYQLFYVIIFLLIIVFEIYKNF